MAEALAGAHDLLATADAFADLLRAQSCLTDGPWSLGGKGHKDVTVVDQVYEVGNDLLDGGAGDDALIGDDSISLAPSIGLPVDLAEDFEHLGKAVAAAGNRLSDALDSLAEIAASRRDVVIEVPHHGHVHTLLEHHVDRIVLGSDVIAGGDGNDWVVGDTFQQLQWTVTLLPAVGIDDCGGGRGHDWHGDDWRGFRFDHDGKVRTDVIERGADTISGGAGDDLLWGDSLVVGGGTIIRAAGVGSHAYHSARHEALDGLERLFVLDDAACRGGADTIVGDEGRDWLIGGGGRDVLIGGPGRDHVHQGENESRALRELLRARIDWQAANNGGWAFKLSPYDKDRPGRGGGPNFAPFDF
ncbi:MAG: hypothetical protein LJE90_16770 [Betaproteobacteria bacterium]|nr:hypothetical protein [Betaproteobacteria bacterium]